MDANGLKSWMLADAAHWRLESDALQYDAPSRTLRLARHRDIPDWPAAEADAIAKLAGVPQSFDRYGTRVFWSDADQKIFATGAVPGNVTLFEPPVGDHVTDIALGYDDLLYVAVAGRITIIDPRARFHPFDVAPPAGFKAWRLAAHPDGGVWALDADDRKLARLLGSPSIVRPHPPYSPNTVRPCEENPDPPRWLLLGGAVWPGDERAVAIASHPEGGLALLLWKTGELARIRRLAADGVFGPALLLATAHTPFSFAWTSATQIALLLPAVNEAPVYSLDDPGPQIPPDGDFYPLRNSDGGPFLHGVTLPPQYPATDGPRELHRLSLPAYSRAGAAANALTLDSGRQATVWHRLYVEAEIPEHCGFKVSLGAVNDPAATPDWYPHQFGAVADPLPGAPRGVWAPAASEVPFHPGMLACPRQVNRSGLFTALIQRSGKAVRSVRGRYLKVRIELNGDGLATPEIAAVRAYASRFSYVEKYLPELYREDRFGADADQSGPATPADFLERFVDNFEGILTPLEDRIADSYLLTRASTAPLEALDWLGSWIGLGFDTAYSEPQRRQLLGATPELYRRRGTLRGLQMALDIATGGAVSRGDIIVLENYRLRRTFATILGADLDDANDPLLAGLSVSGNSFVGDTLILGDEHHKEFLALYRDTLPKTKSEQNAVAAFFDGLAYRITILAHQEVQPQDLGLIRRVVSLETPAHVEALVARASNQFRAGVASLVGVDTYLGPKPPPGIVRVDRSLIGRGDLIERAPALDPRLGGEDFASRPPTADLIAPDLAQPDESFTLNAGDSKAFEGRAIVKYIWTMLD